MSHPLSSDYTEINLKSLKYTVEKPTPCDTCRITILPGEQVYAVDAKNDRWAHTNHGVPIDASFLARLRAIERDRAGSPDEQLFHQILEELRRLRLALLEELHGHVVGMPIRIEALGGQSTSYVQRATLLDWIEVEIEKTIKSSF